MSYKEFSYYYDYFNANADYDSLFSTVYSWLKTEKITSGIVCDLGCGTGEMAFRFSEKGYEVIAVDKSTEMLDVFMDKFDEIGFRDILILNQDITMLDLYGTVDVFLCTFDTVNHLYGEAALQKLFDKVSLFIDPKGVFIFDVNTEYKHTDVLADNCFDIIEEEAECHWSSSLIKEENKTKIDINILDKQTNKKYFESFYEYYYPLDKLEKMLCKSRLKIVKCIDGENFNNIEKSTQRYLIMVKKEQ